MATPSLGGWNPCPEGELRKLAHRLSGRRRLRLACGAAAGAALAVTAGLAAAEVAIQYMESAIAPLAQPVCPPGPGSPPHSTSQN